MLANMPGHVVLTQQYTHDMDNKQIVVNHPITYVSGLFKGSQLNWAALTKEAYAIYMSIKKPHILLGRCRNHSKE